MERIQRLISGIWLGSAVFLMLSAAAVFRAAPNATSAADVVGALLTRWHYIALAAPLLLFGLELRRVRPFILILLFTSVILAAGQSLIDLRIRAIRISTVVPVSSLPEGHAIRRNFGRLHGLSMFLLTLQALAAATVVASRSSRVEPVSKSVAIPAGEPPRESDEPLVGGDAALFSEDEARVAEEGSEPGPPVVLYEPADAVVEETDGPPERSADSRTEDAPPRQ
ncbi:MAG TPA: hypothetical protein VF701_07775 [Thermoanaerobaculia bacterium]